MTRTASPRGHSVLEGLTFRKTPGGKLPPVPRKRLSPYLSIILPVTNLQKIPPVESDQMSDFTAHALGCMRPFKIHSPKGLIMGTCSKKNPCEKCQKRFKALKAGLCIAEMQDHPASSFLTLTYDPANLPSTLEDSKRDIQLWLKTLRNRSTETLTFADQRSYTAPIPKTFRYYAAAEFGPKQGRLHWHLLLFGVACLFPHPKAGGKPWKALSKSWDRGFITWEPATVSRCAYTTSYCVKKQADTLNCDLFSNKPGLGTQYFQKLGTQAYLLGLLPQNIPSLQIGKSHWPLTKRARQNLTDAWMISASLAGDLDAMRLTQSVKFKRWFEYKAKVDLVEELTQAPGYYTPALEVSTASIQGMGTASLL